jgi:hypothetical protein
MHGREVLPIVAGRRLRLIIGTPQEARLDRIALIDSATGEVWPVSPVQS